MKITVKDREVELKYSLRIYMVFESMVNRAFNPNLTGDAVMLFLAAILSSDSNCDIDLDGLIDMIDEEPMLLDDFIKWYSAKVSLTAKKKTKAKEIA